MQMVSVKRNDQLHNDWITDQQEGGTASYKRAAESYRSGQSSKLGGGSGDRGRQSYWHMDSCAGLLVYHIRN